jgi:3-oxoacyl-[acyl-carrier protein] reductase
MQTPQPPLLNGRLALVTGAAGGIGRAIAVAYAGAGARVVLTDTRADACASAVAEIEALGGSAWAFGLDITDVPACQALAQRVGAEIGAIDILVNNAGITRDTLLLRMKPEDWDQVIATNLTSVFRLSKACLRRMMKERRGRIVNVTSVVGAIGNAGQANYAAAKAGIIGFTKSLAREVASRHITVNAVAPGFIDTDMTRVLSDDQRAALTGQIPAGRLGEPADIAAAVAFLVSPAAAYITGHTLHVNGGMYMA